MEYVTDHVDLCDDEACPLCTFPDLMTDND
jgi:hypothetical protein